MKWGSPQKWQTFGRAGMGQFPASFVVVVVVGGGGRVARYGAVDGLVVVVVALQHDLALHAP